MEIQKSHQEQNLPRPSSERLADDAVDLFFEKKSVLTHYGESLAISDTIRRPSIGKLVKSNGNDLILVFVTGVLNEFLSFVPNALSADEIVLYAEKIISHCPKWSTADLVLCLKNGMDGRYGPIKFRWTWTSDFVEWAAKYDQEKVDFLYKRHEAKKNEPQVDIISKIPQHIMEKFRKTTIDDPKKEDLSGLKVPREVVDQGLDAVNAYIEEFRKTKKEK